MRKRRKKRKGTLKKRKGQRESEKKEKKGRRKEEEDKEEGTWGRMRIILRTLSPMRRSEEGRLTFRRLPFIPKPLFSFSFLSSSL